MLLQQTTGRFCAGDLRQLETRNFKKRGVFSLAAGVCTALKRPVTLIR
jgi:hypothetical protein